MTCLGVLNRREQGDDNETSLKEGGLIEMSTTVLPFTLTIITIYYSDTIKLSNLKIKHFDDNYNLVIDDTTKFQLFDFLVYTVWACLKGMTPYNTLKEESSHKNHYNDSYSAPFACRS